MECLKQFNLSIATGKNFSTAAGNYVSWTTGTTNSFVIQSGTDVTTFNVQGFKNINLHGIKLMGSVQSELNTNYGIVEDYSFFLQLTGQTPSISGTFSTPNNWGANLFQNQLRIGKYQNEINFAEPIKSLSTISISNFSAQGYNNNSPLSIRLEFFVQLYFFYTFEGENEEFAFL